MNKFFFQGVDTKLHLLELVGHYSGETEWVVVDALLSVLDDIESLVQENIYTIVLIELNFKIKNKFKGFLQIFLKIFM